MGDMAPYTQTFGVPTRGVGLQVGSPQLKFLQGTLHSCDGVYGARFSGAGTRGACVALVQAGAAEQVAAQASRAGLGVSTLLM